MTTGIVLTPERFARWERNNQLVERFLPLPPDRVRRDPPQPDNRLWFRCVPDSASVGVAPAFGVIKIVGSTMLKGQPALTFEKPDADSLQGCAILWGHDVPDNQEDGGWCTFEPAFALYNTANTPEWDQSWGTEEDKWMLKKDNSGFKILGGSDGSKVLVKQVPSGGVFCHMIGSHPSFFDTDFGGGPIVLLEGGLAENCVGMTRDDTNGQIIAQTAGIYVCHATLEFEYNQFAEPGTGISDTVAHFTIVRCEDGNPANELNSTLSRFYAEWIDGESQQYHISRIETAHLDEGGYFRTEFVWTWPTGWATDGSTSVNLTAKALVTKLD